MPKGRPVLIRASYLNDAGYLNRLAQAIEKDIRRPEKWRDEQLTLLRQLIVNFTTAESVKEL